MAALSFPSLRSPFSPSLPSTNHSLLPPSSLPTPSSDNCCLTCVSPPPPQPLPPSPLSHSPLPHLTPSSDIRCLTRVSAPPPLPLPLSLSSPSLTSPPPLIFAVSPVSLHLPLTPLTPLPPPSSDIPCLTRRTSPSAPPSLTPLSLSLSSPLPHLTLTSPPPLIFAVSPVSLHLPLSPSLTPLSRLPHCTSPSAPLALITHFS
uniref:Uncharacterized protein n=1 Tax=Knipowitschia caucasica TaxID=637954 RepID=A0AAV2J2F0_KNICA